MLHHAPVILRNFILYSEEMLQAVTEAVFEMIDARLQRQHRLLVATCIGLVSLNMTCEKEDYVKAFLVPLNLDQTCLWEGVVPPKKKEEEGEVDEEERDEDKDMEDGKDKEEEKVEEEGEEKSDIKEPEVKSDEAMEEQDQAEETFPSWMPSGCKIKVCFTNLTHSKILHLTING